MIITTRRRLLKGSAAALGLVPLAACSALVPATQAPALYVLAGKTPPLAGPAVPWSLTLEEPSSSTALDTDYIALSPATNQIEYFKDVRWASRLPLMVQTLLLESFEGSRRITAVGRQAVGLRSDYDLSIEIRDFTAEYSDSAKTTPPVIHLRLAAKMIGSVSRNITAFQSFEVKEPAAATDMTAIMAAFSRAATRIAADLLPWVLSQPVPKR